MVDKGPILASPFSRKLTHWYKKHQRPLPWRGDPDPYAVWVSEIMAQQTRIDTVLPYFERWMKRFPSIAKLAAAPQRDVLAVWEGLGYYSRARNLHAAAQVVMAEHGGHLPADAAALRRLPGIGRYTAGAIASLAFGQDEPVVDGNVKRVLSRVFDVTEPVDAPAGERRIWALAAEHLPPGHAADYNQGLMELGALVCLPRAPRCGDCPLQSECRAFALGNQQERPLTKPKAAIPHWTVAAAVIQLRGGKVLLAQRPAGGLLGGLWEFPGGKQEDGETLPRALRREIKEELGVTVKIGAELGVFKHAYSHFRVTLHAFACTLEKGTPRAIQAQKLVWAAPAELPEYPMGKLDRQIARTLMKS
ncbi:MAG: A/G-specific adenine glycosylase [Anaerolineae bacterium]|nr:MAG: A/G-specific adenine glycosylase [Anaerolineae bacterium]